MPFHWWFCVCVAGKWWWYHAILIFGEWTSSCREDLRATNSTLSLPAGLGHSQFLYLFWIWYHWPMIWGLFSMLMMRLASFPHLLLLPSVCFLISFDAIQFLFVLSWLVFHVFFLACLDVTNQFAWSITEEFPTFSFKKRHYLLSYMHMMITTFQNALLLHTIVYLSLVCKLCRDSALRWA